MRNINSDSITNTADAIGDLVAEKNLAYGDAFSKAGEVLKILYPDGVSTDKYLDILVTVRILDKLFRIANSKDAFGESPWQDIAGYGILMSAYSNAKIEEK